MKTDRQNSLTRRDAIRSVGVLAGTSLLTGFAGSENSFAQSKEKNESSSNEEYVWLSANANLPLFVAHDHPALRLAGETLGAAYNGHLKALARDMACPINTAVLELIDKMIDEKRSPNREILSELRNAVGI